MTNIDVNPIQRLSKDLAKASVTLSDEEARFLTDSYYLMQENRKRSDNQVRSMSAEPHTVIAWLAEQSDSLENQIKRALDKYSDSKPVGQWMKCAPPESRVLVSSGRWSTFKTVPICELHDGDEVVPFDRRRARMALPTKVRIASRHYSGNLITVMTNGEQTRVTPGHKWLVRVDAPKEACIVYLMQQGNRFRVGRSKAILNPPGRNGRFALRGRARQERAENIWILKFCETRKDASVYETLVSIKYGLPMLRFFSDNYHGYHLDQEAIDKIFGYLDPQIQHTRAMECLLDHGLTEVMPLVGNVGHGTKESVAGLTVHAANLIPGLMSIPVPLRGGGIEWRKIEKISANPYDGLVYSLDVSKHHRYVQDGLVTCNSIYGIGPVIAAGLMAHIDIKKAVTAGHIWRFAGLDPTMVWNKGEKRPWNASLKTLCWKIGQSFMKFSNEDDCFYGKLYRERKKYEIERNESGRNAAEAAAILTRKKFKKSTEAFKHLSGGKLPPAQIDARARRYAVKIFLSHLQQVWWFLENGQMPPKPYAINKLGHAHYILPPNVENIAGFMEALNHVC